MYWGSAGLRDWYYSWVLKLRTRELKKIGKLVRYDMARENQKARVPKIEQTGSECIESCSHHQDGDAGGVSYSRVVEHQIVIACVTTTRCDSTDYMIM